MTSFFGKVCYGFYYFSRSTALLVYFTIICTSGQSNPQLVLLTPSISLNPLSVFLLSYKIVYILIKDFKWLFKNILHFWIALLFLAHIITMG